MLVVANVLVFVLIASGASGALYVRSLLHQIHHVHVSINILPKPNDPVKLVGPPGHRHFVKVKPAKKAPKSPPFTMLLIGSDSRALAEHSGLNVGNSTTNAENLSDSIILVRVAPATRTMALLSIPRDLWVNIPGLGYGKINEAFSGNDPTRLIEVIEQTLGIPVNHFAEVGFDAFEEIADAIGGVEQYFPTPAFDSNSDLTIPKAGCVLLKGSEALSFVRSRDYEYIDPGQPAEYQQVPESDLGRIQRQQAFIKNAIKKTEDGGALDNPLKVASIIDAITKNLTVDSTFSTSALVSMAEDFSHVDPNSIPDLTLPVANVTEPGGAAALNEVPGESQATIAKFLAIGTTPPAVKATKKPGTSKTTTKTAPTTTIAHNTISVDVENGSGVANQATEASTALQAGGFDVTGGADASNYNYVANVVEYGPSGLAAAHTLDSWLEGGATLTADSSLTGTNLILITGSKWAGAATRDSGSSTTSVGSSASTTTTTTAVPTSGQLWNSSPTVTPDSSSFYDGVYIPPGREPGQKVSTCGN
jgi:LCP family protein required for cell wall assembly